MTYYHRVLFQIYLSNHNCGTEFSGYNKTIMSVKGRGTLFYSSLHIHIRVIFVQKKRIDI